MKSLNLRNLIPFHIAIAALAFGLLLPAETQAQDLQELYFKASEFAQQGKFDEALKVYNEAIGNFASEGDDFSWDDYGPQFGGIFYDKGVCLLQLSQYEEARDAFQKCHEDYPNNEKVPYGNRQKKARVDTINMRWELSLFQWAYCEQKLENFEKALELYDKFLAAKPDPSILKTVHSAFVLRKGATLIGLERFDEGEKEIKRLFTEYDTTFRGTSGQLLFQAMLDLANGWTLAAEKDKDGVTKRANEFLNSYSSLFSIGAYDKARLGFAEQLRIVGYRAQQSGLYEVALRFFSMVPTTQDILQDLETRAAQTGGAAQAAYMQVIGTYEEKLNSPDPPEVDTLRLIAASWERLGNRHAGYVVNRHLIENYPKSKHMPELLHEAARYAFALGDGSAAQYYGETFMAKYPTHELRDNVATFMLQSLFRNQKFEICLDVAGNVRNNFDPGSPQRDLADFVYGASLYSLNRQEDAKPELDLHVEKYPNSDYREQSRYYQASNRIILGAYEEAAPMLDSFLGDYPESPFRDQALFDRATCYYIANDFLSALQNIDQIRDTSPVLDRAYNLKGDTLRAMANTPEEGKEADDYKREAVEAYLVAKDAAERMEHADYRAEALFKLVDTQSELEQWEEAVKYYDMFFPDHVGNYFEPQISVFGMDALKEAGRAEDGLKQLERMIVALSEDTNRIELLQQAIGSYHDASIEVREHDPTIAKYDEIIAANPGNSGLQSWLMIHKIMALQDKKGLVRENESQVAAVDSGIDKVFQDLTKFEINALSDIALKAIGEHLESKNPFEAKRYFEELIIRDTALFKPPADMALGRIEIQNPDTREAGVQRFIRVIRDYSDPKFEAEKLIPEARLNLGRVGVQTKNWKMAADYLKPYINQDKGQPKQFRAEASHLYGLTLESQGDTKGAISVYNKNFAANGAYPEWSAESMRRAVELQYKKDAPTPEEKRESQLAAYGNLRLALYVWQQVGNDVEPLNLLRQRRGTMETEMALTPAEIEAVEKARGIDKRD